MPFSGLTRLYIRQSYQDIASTILACSKRTKSLITGTPGIGKSVFLLYLLWKLVKSGKRVLIIDDSDKVYYDGNGGIFELEALPPSTRRSFWSDDLWCLFDAKNKTLADLNLVPYKRGSSVLSTSPRRDLVNDFKKPSKPQVYFKFIMPLWSHLELKEIAPKFEKSFGWEYRFKVLGGIPRFVLEDTDVEATAILEAACRSCEVDHCIKITGNVSEISENTPKVAHSLVHLNSTFPYETASARFASETALSTIIRIRKADCRRQMQSLLQSCAGNPVTAAFIFEAFAIEKLEKGGKFKCKELVAASVRTKPIPEDVEISPSTRQAVKKVAPDQEHDRLYVPEAKNYHGMDAWIHGKGAFQMTVGKKHAITSKAFDDIRILGNKFYWAVPPLHYEKFPKRGPPEIQEFALLIPYPTGADVQDDPDSICVSDQKEADIQEDVDMMCVSDSTEADKQVQEDPGIMSSV